MRGVVIKKDTAGFGYGKKLNKESNLYMTLPAPRTFIALNRQTAYGGQTVILVSLKPRLKHSLPSVP